MSGPSTPDPIAALLAWIAAARTIHGIQCRYCGRVMEKNEERHAPDCIVPDLRRALAARTEGKDWRESPKNHAAVEAVFSAFDTIIQQGYRGRVRCNPSLLVTPKAALDALCDAVAASSTGAPR